MANKYLEKIARRVSHSKVRKLYDDGKEVYDEGKDMLEVKKRLTKKNSKLSKTIKVVDQNAKKRVSVTGRKWNRGVTPNRKK